MRRWDRDVVVPCNLRVSGAGGDREEEMHERREPHVERTKVGVEGREMTSRLLALRVEVRKEGGAADRAGGVVVETSD